MSRRRARVVDRIAANAAPDTAEHIAYRVRARAAAQQVERERTERYPTLTAENIAAALSWQESRLRELMGPAPTT